GKTLEDVELRKDEPVKVWRKELCRQDLWGQGRVKRLLGTGAGLLFKGSGFYITDYRSSGYKESAKKEGNSSSKEGSSSSGSDAKPGSDKPSSPSDSSNKPPSAGS